MSPPTKEGLAHESPPEPREIQLVEAIREALWQAMESDERVFLLGEDIAELGGAFGATRGLLERFGRRRVLDTPMCEWAFVGLANGAAMLGLRPVVEIQFADFISTAFDPIVQYAATTPYRWGAEIPLVVRAPWGGGSSAGPFHSQCPEAWFAHTPGLKVVVPSNPHDAKGLLLAAIDDPNPVIFFEPKHLYRRGREPVPIEPFRVPLGCARLVQHGDDASVITYGAMVEECVEALASLEAEGVTCDLIDLRTIAPLDLDTVLESVAKTGRALIVHEATRTCGLGAEIAATLADQAFESLDAPVRRVTAPDTPVPYAPVLEKAFRPHAGRIATELRTLLAY